MNAFSTNPTNRSLKVTLLFSLLLHATGFYIFSNISFNLVSRSHDAVPIKVTVLDKKNRIPLASIINTSKQKQPQSAHSPKLISTEFKEIKSKKPTPVYKKNYLLNPSQKDSKKRNPVTVNQMQLASSHSRLSQNKSYYCHLYNNLLLSLLFPYLYY